MEKEKLEKSKIEEKDLGNIAGGFDYKVNVSELPPESVGTFFVNDEELGALDQAGILRVKDGEYEMDEEDLDIAGVTLFGTGFMPDSETGNKRGKNKIKVK